jgi:hypothetical protein
LIAPIWVLYLRIYILCRHIECCWMDTIITIDSYDAVKTNNRYMLAHETVFNSSMQISQKIAEKFTFK